MENRRIAAISERLEDLVGQDEAKGAYRHVLDRMRYRSLLESQGKEVPAWTKHMTLEGSAGTGKTTFAELIAQTLNAAGELEKSKVEVVNASSIIGEYVGQSNVAMQEAFERAQGGVLFVDEAHTLFDTPYGRSALQTLIPLMERHREDTAVMFAGYPGMREKLNKIDRGFDGRVPTDVHFKDYTPDEQVEIFTRQADRRGVTLDGESRLALTQLLPEYVGENNARGVRNAFEAVESAHIGNVFGSDGGKEASKITLDDVVEGLRGKRRNGSGTGAEAA